MKRKLLFLLVMAFSAGAAMAQSQQKVIIGGETVSKNVTQLSFTGEQVNITFDDNSTQSVDISDLSIEFTYTTSGVSKVNEEESKKKDDTTYNLNGQKVSVETKGVVIQNGKKKVNK